MQGFILFLFFQQLSLKFELHYFEELILGFRPLHQNAEDEKGV